MTKPGFFSKDSYRGVSSGREEKGKGEGENKEIEMMTPEKEPLESPQPQPHLVVAPQSSS